MSTSIAHLGVAAALLVALSPLTSVAATPSPGPDMVLVRPTTKSADQVADAIKAYADTKKWVFLGANKVKKGEVTLVKVCIPEVGQMVWALGLHLSALLPCGNLSVYQKAGQTEISMLHPRYMYVLYPRPEIEKAADAAAPPLIEMLDAVAK